MDYSLIVSSGLGLIATGLFFVAFRHFNRVERHPGFENRQAPELVPQLAMASSKQSANPQRRAPAL